MFADLGQDRVVRRAAFAAAGLLLAALLVLVAGSAPALAGQAPAQDENLQPPDPYLILSVNYGHDWVEGHYEADHTLWLTVTDEAGVVKATAELETMQIPWWAPGDTGFATNVDENAWNPSRPDMEAGDWVYGRIADNRRTAQVQLGEITGTPDAADDTIAGNVHAGWLPAPVRLSCNVWEEGGPSLDLWIDPDGGSYECDLGALGWNLLPGHDLAVQYQEPGGHQVMNVFKEPAPNLSLEKWAEGSGRAYPGGPAVFHLRVRNQGDAPAAQVIVTDTLPTNASYAGDSSGVAPTFAGDQLVWDLGPLAAEAQIDFYLYLDHTAGAGGTVHNVADAWALYEDDAKDNHAEADVQVIDGLPDVYVNKHPETGNPLPGGTMLWRLECGNQGPVASGPVELTDTLPEGTTVVEWWSENGYGWEEVASGDELVLQTPSLPGHWGDQIYLRLALDPDVALGTQLTNRAEIETSADTEPGNDWSQRDDVWVSDELWNAHVQKSLSWTTLVPGGEIEYSVDVRNNGNVDTTFTVTDVLPAGTSFVGAWQQVGPTRLPLTPVFQDDEVVVLDLGVLQPGDWSYLQVRLAILPATPVGAVLENCATVAMEQPDRWPYDNEACYTLQVGAPGPNLLIEKSYQWNGDSQLEYDIQLHNVGTAWLESGDLIDALPEGVTFNGNWGYWFPAPIELTGQSATQLTWTYERMEPGWGGGLRFQVDLDGDLVGVPGLAFTNTMEAPVAGDVTPADNEDTAVAITGPDLYVEKELTGGQPAPGELVTFTVMFGNANDGPWGTSGTHLIDTLPEGTTFVTATIPWDRNYAWPPETVDGNTITWGWQGIDPGQIWVFDVVARIDADAAHGDVLVNTVEIVSDDPEQDAEFYTANNTAEAAVTVQAGYRLYLPILVRNY